MEKYHDFRASPGAYPSAIPLLVLLAERIIIENEVLTTAEDSIKRSAPGTIRAIEILPTKNRIHTGAYITIISKEILSAKGAGDRVHGLSVRSIIVFSTEDARNGVSNKITRFIIIIRTAKHAVNAIDACFNGTRIPGFLCSPVPDIMENRLRDPGSPDDPNPDTFKDMSDQGNRKTRLYGNLDFPGVWRSF